MSFLKKEGVLGVEPGVGTIIEKHDIEGGGGIEEDGYKNEMDKMKTQEDKNNEKM
jgi:hypothetical protein